MSGLEGLSARLAQDLAWLEQPAKPWLPTRYVHSEPVVDVAIMGAGMAGLAACAALRLLGVNAQVYDRAAAGREGPWLGYARMQTLRSPKQLSGPALGLPALTFRAWYEAQFGLAAWQALDKIPRTQWMQYLVWYRQVLGLPVHNHQCLTAIEPEGNFLRLQLATPDGVSQVHARRLVLATGRDGLGGPFMPELFKHLPPERCAHSAEDIDFTALTGCRVGVIGAGASAMDNAARALEAGAASVDLFIRRRQMPTINKGKGISGPGNFIGFAGLPDLDKWQFSHYVNQQQVPAPRDSTLRVSRHANARFHLASPVSACSADAQGISLDTPHGRHRLDFLICATGFQVDLARRPELATVAANIRLWRDEFQAPQADAELDGSPYLRGDFAFQEKYPGRQPWLQLIHCFNYPAVLSLGKIAGDIPGISEGALRLARGLVEQLFVAEKQAMFQQLCDYAEPELLGDEWTNVNA